MKKAEMYTAIKGACVLASGGGGSYQVAKKIIDQGILETDTADVVSTADAEDDKWLAVSANMGSPDALFTTANPHAPANAFSTLEKRMTMVQLAGFAKFPGFEGTLSYVLPVEVGAINTASPLTVACQKSIPVVDGDGAYRSIPTLPLTVFANNVPMYACVASEAAPGCWYNSGMIDVQTEDDAEEAIIGLVTTDPFEGIAGLALYPMTGKKMKDTAVGGSLKDSLEIGKLFGYTGDERASKIKEYLNSIYWSEYDDPLCDVVWHGDVIKIEQKSMHGVDTGRIILNSYDSDETLLIINENENILAYCSESPDDPFVMGPDSICYIPGQGEPYDNSDMWRRKEFGSLPRDVYILAVRARKKIVESTSLMDSWGTVRNQYGYAGPYESPWLSY